jgi:hypothetical protein
MLFINEGFDGCHGGGALQCRTLVSSRAMMRWPEAMKLAVKPVRLDGETEGYGSIAVAGPWARIQSKSGAGAEVNLPGGRECAVRAHPVRKALRGNQRDEAPQTHVTQTGSGGLQHFPQKRLDSSIVSVVFRGPLSSARMSVLPCNFLPGCTEP